MRGLNHNLLAGLFFVATFSRGILLSVLPLKSLELLGSAQLVSFTYFAASGLGIVSSLSMPSMVRFLGGRYTFLAGSIAMVASSLLLAAKPTPIFLTGMFVHVFAVVFLDVTLSLHVMERIGRSELTRFEPKRVFCMVAALSVGPWLGVYLGTRAMDWIPYGVATLSALLSVAYFLALGLHKDQLLKSERRGSSVLRNVRRFSSQPRLLLAWLLTVARSSWWAMFIIYTPIYAAQSGQDSLMGSAVVSIGAAWTLTLPLWGWIGRTYGLRRLMYGGFLSNALVMAIVFACSDSPQTVLVLLVVAALGTTAIDGAGNVLFMRAVRPLERPEMTGVFQTYRDFAQLAPPGIFAFLLHFFPLSIVFMSSGVWMFLAAWFCRFIPRRM